MTDPVKPVFILGTQHSGTSLMQRMLSCHPDATWFSQFSLRDGSIPARRSLPLSDRLDVVLRRYAHHDWQKAKWTFRRRLVPQPGETKSIWSDLLSSDAASAVRLRSTLTDFMQRMAKLHFVAKWPQFHAHIDLLRAAFPDACFVHNIRDGRAFAVSMRSKAMSKGQRERDLAYWAVRWLDELHAVESHGDNIDVVEVKYEELCVDVRGTLAIVLSHAGLNPDRFPYGRCPDHLNSLNERRLSLADAQERAELTERLRATLEIYGYPVG